MNIKQPAVYDLSHWKEVSDFSVLNPRPVMVITKATEGIDLVDYKFIRFFAEMKKAGYLRGAYHFHRKAFSPVRQAQFFTDYIRPYIDQDTLLILDMEEGGESAASVLMWLDYVRGDMPDNEILLYSRRNILEQMLMTTAQKEAFRKIKIWTAGYPTNPDQYNSVPGFYIPDPTRFGPTVLWQYSASGQVAGIQGEVDLNWIDPVYLQMLGGTPPPASTEYQKLRRFDSDAHILTIDPAAVPVRISVPGRLETVSSAAKRAGAKYAVNGDMWDELLRPQSLCYADGRAAQSAQIDFRPFLNVDRDRRAAIRHTGFSDLFNTVSGVRYIVQGSVKPTYLFENKPEYTERHPRTAAGLLPGGLLLFVVVDGRSVFSAGVTLSQLADILLEFGCVTGIDLDGGGSSTLAVDGQVVNVPSDGSERAVVNHVLIGSGGTTMASYEIKSTAYDMSLRADHNVSAVRLETVLKNTPMLADSIWMAAADGSNVKAGDKWAHVVSIGGVTKNGWVAIVHLGVTYCTATEIVQPPPPPAPTFPGEIGVTISGVTKTYILKP